MSSQSAVLGSTQAGCHSGSCAASRACALSQRSFCPVPVRGRRLASRCALVRRVDATLRTVAQQPSRGQLVPPLRPSRACVRGAIFSKASSEAQGKKAGRELGIALLCVCLLPTGVILGSVQVGGSCLQSPDARPHVRWARGVPNREVWDATLKISVVVDHLARQIEFLSVHGCAKCFAPPPRRPLHAVFALVTRNCRFCQPCPIACVRLFFLCLRAVCGLRLRFSGQCEVPNQPMAVPCWGSVYVSADHEGPMSSQITFFAVVCSVSTARLRCQPPGVAALLPPVHVFTHGKPLVYSCRRERGASHVHGRMLC